MIECDGQYELPRNTFQLYYVKIKNNGQGNNRPDQYTSYKYIILTNDKQLDLAEIVEVFNLDIVIGNNQLGNTSVLRCNAKV